ncbi:DUF6599 family protein [Thermodesulfobacteriota bacterium]
MFSKKAWPLLSTLMACLLILPACASTGINTAKVRALVPIDHEVSGWTRDGGEIVCQNLAELTQRINGGAPFFIDRGVRRVVFQDYQKTGGTYINLEIYQTETSSQAERIFRDYYVDQPVELNEIGSTARLADNLIGVYFLDFYQSNFYVRLTITEKTGTAKNDLVLFARKVSGKITS